MATRKQRAPKAVPGYDLEMALRICEELSAGESARHICAQPGFPTLKTIMRWLAKHEEFRVIYAEARLQGMEKVADEIIPIADEVNETPEAVAKAKLRVNTRQWLLSKMLPRRFGEQLTLAGDKERPLTVTISNEDATVL